MQYDEVLSSYTHIHIAISTTFECLSQIVAGFYAVSETFWTDIR